MALVTLEKLKTASGEYLDPLTPSVDDDRLQQAIDAASALIRAYTGLSFDVQANPPVSSSRSFEYDGSGFLTINECTNITSVTVNGGYSYSPTRTLTVDDWSAYPLNLPVKLWLRLPEGGGYGMSPEMGFTWNLDTYGYRYTSRPQIVTVTARWGWPTIPADVQQAAIWTAMSLAETTKPYHQESIESYSRTRASDAEEEPIPARAQLALQPYVVPEV